MSVKVSAAKTALFWTYVDKREPSQCWEWRGCYSANGYGCFALEYGVKAGAHRVAFAIRHGFFPGRRRVVRHTCDNPRCVNADHLVEGTHADNLKDARERGLWKPRTRKEPANAVQTVPADANISSLEP